ncbi:hypothetical protein GCM10023166_06840 [Paeniglutamicibacter cryotolerans]
MFVGDEDGLNVGKRRSRIAPAPGIDHQYPAGLFDANAGMPKFRDVHGISVLAGTAWGYRRNPVPTWPAGRLEAAATGFVPGSVPAPAQAIPPRSKEYRTDEHTGSRTSWQRTACH